MQCITLLDTLLTEGVDAIAASRVVASTAREKLKPDDKSKPKLSDVYGGGSIVGMANNELCNLNILGQAAPDLRTRKPCCQP